LAERDEGQAGGKSAITREKILDAAIRLFSRRGYRGTSVADIAKEAGVAKSAVFWYFGTKDGLLEMVVKKLVSGSVQQMIDEILTTEDADEADLLNTLLEHLQKKLGADPELNRAYLLLQIETYHEGREAGKPFEQALDSCIRFFTMLVANGQQKGVFNKDCDPEDVAVLIFLLTMGAYNYWYRNPEVKTSYLYGVIRKALKKLIILHPEKWPEIIGEEQEDLGGI